MSEQKIMCKEKHTVTDSIFDNIAFNSPLNPGAAEDVVSGINEALGLEDTSFFLKGVHLRLNEIGVKCTADDKNIIEKEIKARYKKILNKSCPKTVESWCRGVTPSLKNRENNYDLCMALEMDYEQTINFFRKHFLAMPFNVKSKVDAVYLYCIYHKKPYSVVGELMSSSKGFVTQENAYTKTAQIYKSILEIEDDKVFLAYLSKHCFDNRQQYMVARELINKEIDCIKDDLLRNSDNISVGRFSKARLNSLTIDAVFGFRFQDSSYSLKQMFPKRFIESLPNDVTLGKIINGQTASYELLRKTLILFRFYNFYKDADNTDVNAIACNLMDFVEEINGLLVSCGFSEVYYMHPFDCLIMYCANSYAPVLTLQYVFENYRN